MIPSRVLRGSNQNISLGRRSIEVASARSFSSIPTPNGPSKPIFLASRTGAFSRKTPLRPQICRAPYILQNGAFLRFQSTSPVVSGAGDTITNNIHTTAWTQDSTSLGSLDNVIDLNSLSLNNIPEQIGYLKAMGLDYGYGPSGMMEWVLEHVHVFAGTPWWASITLTALIVRLVCLYPNFMGTDNAAKMAAVAPLAKPLMEQMKESGRLGDNGETMRIRAELQMMNKRAGVRYWKALFPLLQAPIGFGTFFCLRGMSNLPVPGLETGGLLWFSNLTLADPFFILPLATAGVLHVVLKKGGETGVPGMSPDFMRGMSYFLPTMSLMFTSFMPSAVQLSFFVTGVLTYCQAQLFRWAPFRTYMDMTPLPKRSDSSASAPTIEASPYQPRIITAKARQTPKSSGSYEPPRGASSPSTTAQQKPTLLSGLRREVKTGISSVQESARKTIKSAREIAGQESKDGKRTKRQLQHANAYEKKRRLEEARRREELDADRKARRDLSRMQREGR